MGEWNKETSPVFQLENDKEKIRESAEKYVQEYLKDDDIHVYSDESFCTCFIY